MIIQKLSAQDIKFHPMSYGDAYGRLFYWEDQLYRAITASKAPFYRNLFEQGIVQRLADKNLLVHTEIYPIAIDGYEMVLKHRSIPFISYPHEWCDEMLKDAARLFLSLNRELEKHDLACHDPRSINILFDGCNPIFVDFCSITVKNDQNYGLDSTYAILQHYFLYPLRTMSKGHEHLTRCWMKDSYFSRDQKIPHELEALNSNKAWTFNAKSYKNLLLQLARQHTPVLIRDFAKKTFISAKKAAFTSRYKTSSNFWGEVTTEIEEIKLLPKKIETSRCYDSFFSSFSESHDWTIKQKTIRDLLIKLKPDSVLDVDSNLGWYAQLAARYCQQVIAFDSDEACVRNLYATSKENNLNILPLFIDWNSPTFNLSNEFFMSVQARFQCELVLSTTFVQCLIFNRHLNFEKSLHRLSMLSNHWLLVEFVPKNELINFIPIHDQPGMQWCKQTPWYTLEEFIYSIKKHFAEVTILPSYPESRKLLLCEKKSY